ncbi:hypothetical protein, partial [Arthrobacter oryzae]|uniref:hypothetical protein n=1 Tax=Arthrobacter oryzae TaxID=409290 RepID=UPI0030C8F001
LEIFSVAYRWRICAQTSNVITFHNGQWPHFQLALLALLSVGVNKSREERLEQRKGSRMAFLGGGRDEYTVQAGELNQNHIGSSFGVQTGGSVLYGELGSIRLYPTHAMLGLAGVAEEPLRLELTDNLYFTHYQFENQVSRHLEDFSTHLRDRK